MRGSCVPQGAPRPLQTDLGALGTGTWRTVRDRLDAWGGFTGLFACFCADTCIDDKQGVEGMAPKLQLEAAPKKPRESEVQVAEAAQQGAPKEAAEAAPVPKEAKPQAPKEAAKQPAEAATPKEAWRRWEPGEFIQVHEWLRGQETAPQAEAEAQQTEK